MRSRTINEDELRQLMNDAAEMALKLDREIRNTINPNVNTQEEADKLIRKSISGIVGTTVTNKAFTVLN